MIEIQDVSFTYNSEKKQESLRNINLHIGKGQAVVICGKSGCGKTTLTRLINGLIPHYFEGDLSGRVNLKGIDIRKVKISDLAGLVGSVFQSPKSQFFTMDTYSEIAFGCENIGLPETEILKRIGTVIEKFRLKNLIDRNLFALSGGEKQRIACAAVSALLPEIIVLDEPSSNLDKLNIIRLKGIIEEWKRQGKTIIIAEHRLHYLKEIVDRIIYMDEGSIILDVPFKDIMKKPENEIANMGLRCLNIDSIHFQDLNEKKNQKKVFQLSRFHYRYDKKTQDIINIEKCNLPFNEIIGIIGNNGQGKSTLARCLCGLSRKFGGELEVDGRTYKGKKMREVSYMVFQDVNHQLFTESVYDEIKLNNPEITDLDIDDILKKINLQFQKDLHPMSLSGGERQRIAIGCALTSKRNLLVFDEPTSGLDYYHMKEVSKILKELQSSGKSIFIISHDSELLASCCTYLVSVNNGNIVWQGKMDYEGQRYFKEYFNY